MCPLFDISTINQPLFRGWGLPVRGWIVIWLARAGARQHVIGLENLLRKWSEISHADLSWSLSELIRLWSQFVDFLILVLFSLSEKFEVSRPFWSCSVDFPHYDALLTEAGHIWGIIWRMCGSKCRGKRRHISDALCRVPSSFTMFLSSYHYEIFRSYCHWQKWCPCKR